MSPEEQEQRRAALEDLDEMMDKSFMLEYSFTQNLNLSEPQKDVLADRIAKLMLAAYQRGYSKGRESK